MKKTSNQWLNSDEFKGIEITDPTGWKDVELPGSYFHHEPIIREEFVMRLIKSDCKIPPNVSGRFTEISASVV